MWTRKALGVTIGFCVLLVYVLHVHTLALQRLIQPTQVNSRQAPIRTQDSPSSDVAKPGHVKVLLVTYHRGGSSFLGEMFQNNPDAWYWFEPLHALPPAWQDTYRRLGETRPAVGMYSYFQEANGSLTEVPQIYTRDRVETIRKALDCDVTDLSTVRDPFFYNPHGRDYIIPYRNCLRTSGRKKPYEEADFRKCLPDLEEACRSNGIIVAKAIRLPVFLLREILDILPDVRVVYQVRDPRGVIASRKWRLQVDVVEAGKLLCLEMAKNHDHFREIRRQYGDRVLQIRYEDLAAQTKDTAAVLYDFLDLEVPSELERWISENTEAADANGMLGTKRNSTKTMAQWRSRLKSHEISGISTHCKDILTAYGYENE